VRSNHGRFRLCYEQGLARNPSLEGRVVVRFIIDQSGSVAHATNAGSTLPDSQVVQCVVQAIPQLSFPPSEGGTVTVVYPILLSPGESPPQPAAWVTPEPIHVDPVHRAQDDSWRQAESKHLETLRTAVKKDERSRRAHARLVRGLLQRGKFEEALTAARRFAGLDPDLPIAHELLAYAEAASGNGSRAVAAIAWLAEAQPRSSRAQVRAAQAYEALRDERRACSHWRAAAELLPKDEQVRYEAVRCTGRVRDPHDALALARAIDKPGEALLGLIALLEKGEPMAAYDPGRGRAGSYEATVTCAPDHECPSLIVLAPDGTVHSPWTPARSRAGRGMVSFQPGVGTYRAILMGKGPAKLSLRAHGVSRTFDVSGEGTRTVAATDLRRPRLRGW
jgi:Ca-activated chloride channel family protein